MNRTAVSTAFAFGAALFAATPQAHAIQNGYDYNGGCDYVSAGDPTGPPGARFAVVAGQVSGYSVADPGESVEVTLSCEILVNGTLAGSLTSNGGTAVTLTGLVPYVATEGDTVDFCSRVAITGDTGTATMVDCDTSVSGLGGRCNGLVDYSCDYCSYDGSSSGSGWSSCEEQPPNPTYFWEGCTVWVNGFCYVG
jgi:hypothetical protein